MNPQDTIARDRAIHFARNEGATTLELADRFGLTRQRIYQILSAPPPEEGVRSFGRPRTQTTFIEGARHGTRLGYYKDLCGCDECYEAYRAYYAETREKRLNRAKERRAQKTAS